MTLVHRHVAKESKEPTNTPLSDGSQDAQRSALRKVNFTYAQAASIPILSIHVPEPIATHNSYSTLNDTITPDSSDSDKYMWKSSETTSDSSESNTDDSDMPALIDESIMDDASDTDYSDMPELINESTDASENTSDESDQEIVVNHKRYQRVKKPCKDGIPCPIIISYTLWVFAIGMQLFFHLCSLTNDTCSPASLLNCSRKL